jgi:hypothetical protein
MSPPLSGFENPFDSRDLAAPLAAFLFKCFMPGGCFSSSAIPANPPSPLHAAQGGKQRPRIYPEHTGAHLLDAKRYSVPVHRFESQCLEHQHFQRPLNPLAIAHAYEALPQII